MKTGRLTLEEMAYIENNYKKISLTDIARKLDRKLESVKNYIAKINTKGDSLETKNLRVEYDIQLRPYWAEIKEQFDELELPLFIYHWEKTISQFKDDVLPTEELQIIDMIKIEILMNRGLKQQKVNQTQISILEKQLLDAHAQNVPDPELITNLSTQIGFARQAQTAWSKDFNELSGRKQRILQELKATRKERVKNIESSRQTFIGMLGQVLQDRNTRKEWGEFIEKMRVATDIELERLSEYHQYQDGVIDQPIFTPENAKEDNVLQA